MPSLFRIIATGTFAAITLFSSVAKAYDASKSLGETYNTQTTVAPDQNRLVIFRAIKPEAKLPPGVATVYLADKYHVSLQDNAYSVICLEADRMDVRVRLTPADGEMSQDTDAHLSLALKKGSTQYLRIQHDPSGRPAVTEIPARIALDELQNVRQQMLIRSRVSAARACKVDPVANKDTHTISFGADADFEFKKTDRRGLTPKGEIAMHQLVNKINNKYIEASKVDVRIVGYADDSLDPLANQRLAVDRANTVKAYLIQNGLRDFELTANTSVTSKEDKNPSDRFGKRRVEVDVFVTTP